MTVKYLRWRIAGIRRLNNLINKAKRHIGSTNNSTLISVENVYKRFCCTRLFKYFILKESNYYHQKFLDQIPNHSILTRFNANNLFSNPSIRSSKFHSSFFYTSMKYWNKLPNEIRNISKLRKFKLRIADRWKLESWKRKNERKREKKNTDRYETILISD